MNRKLRKTAAVVSAFAMTAAATAVEAVQQAAAEETIVCEKVSEVEGTFSFDQNVISPADDVFSIMGTAVTGICAKPAFVLGEEGEQREDHFINVSGSMKKTYSVDVNSLAKKKSSKRIMACSCSGSLTVANAEVRGVPLTDVLSMAELAQDANTVTVYGSDGFGIPMPLEYALEKEAMLVYEVGGKALPAGVGTVQLWVPETVGKYFTRDVARIEVTAEKQVPAVQEDSVRAKISLLNHVDGETFKAGQMIDFEGYADDNGSPVAAVEFSMDGGENWSAFETEETTADRWVRWNFAYEAKKPGNYRLDVRARTADGAVSPLASTVFFTVD